MDSVSQKHRVFADKPSQLQKNGISRLTASLLIANQTTVSIKGEWLEAFWCDHCQQRNWYYIRYTNPSEYHVVLAPDDLWQRVTGVVDAHGNPSVGEFTRRSSRQTSSSLLKRFYDN